MGRLKGLLPTKEEEEILVKNAKRDDPGALDKLIKQYTPLIQAIASKLSRQRKAEYDDLMQEGYLGLLRSVKNYDVNIKTTRFVTFATIVINDFMMDEILKQAKHLDKKINLLKLECGTDDTLERLITNDLIEQDIDNNLAVTIGKFDLGTILNKKELSFINKRFGLKSLLHTNKDR